MNFNEISVVHKRYKETDPRTLPFLYPDSINIVYYSKKVQVFSFFYTLEVAENLVKKLGYILLPWKCMHWERVKEYGEDRRVKIGRRSFFMMKMEELTPTEKEKLKIYIEELNNSSIYKNRG